MSSFEDHVIIYALLDPTDDKPFYVGSTRITIRLRLAAHISESLSDTMPKSAKCRKIKSLLDQDLRPLIEPLEECEGVYRAEREQHWYQLLKENGETLLNTAKIVGYSPRWKAVKRRRDAAVPNSDSPVEPKSYPYSLRLTDEGIGILRGLSNQLGVSQARIAELALRQLAEEYLKENS